MSPPSGRPEFFILEAGEYLERIALHAGHPAPNRDSLLRFARALRGSALMAGPPGYAVAAGALEDLARGYRDGTIDWSLELAGRVAGAVEQCRDLLLRVRQWSAADIERCRRIAESLQEEAPIVPIESLAHRFEPEIVPIESLAPWAEGAVVPIESLFYDESVPGPVAPAGFTAFERSFSTYFRLIHAPTETEAVPIQKLLYRGRRALERADLVRRELVAERRARSDSAVIESLLDELLDLVPLALDRD
jgi:chemotaxis protein histidine kinase CheA